MKKQLKLGKNPDEPSRESENMKQLVVIFTFNEQLKIFKKISSVLFIN